MSSAKPVSVLVIDDDPGFLEFLCAGLRSAGIEAEGVDAAEPAMDLLHNRPEGSFDLVLLDVNLPGRSGWEMLDELRGEGNEIAVIYVTGRDTVEEKVKGLGLGADDYVVKPLDLPELVARIHSVIRRHQSLEPIVFGDLRLDVARRRVRRCDTPVDLSPREFDLLLALVRARGELVSRRELLRDVWDMEFDPGTNVLDVHVGRLRRKLDVHGRPLIQNERGKGYRVIAHDPEPPASAEPGESGETAEPASAPAAEREPKSGSGPVGFD